MSRYPPRSCCTRHDGSATRRRTRHTDRMESTFDLIIIGAGPGGEAAAHKARTLGAAVALVDRKWLGGRCPHMRCPPPKALLPPGGARAAKLRVFKTNRGAPPGGRDRGSHVRALEKDGVVVYRGGARIVGKG